jgi:hypothetical protein
MLLASTITVAACSGSSASPRADADAGDAQASAESSAPAACGQRKTGLFAMTIDGDIPACLKNKDGTPSSTFDQLRVLASSVQIGDTTCDGGGTYGACAVSIACAAPVSVDSTGFYGRPVEATITFSSPTEFTATFHVDIPQINCAGTVSTRGRWLL